MEKEYTKIIKKRVVENIPIIPRRSFELKDNDT